MGKILVVEDQQVCLDALRLNLADLNLSENAEFYSQSQSALTRVKMIISEAQSNTTKLFPGRPIQAMLLDF